MTDYNAFFKETINQLKIEGNYRVFADLEKIAGNFPQALNYKENTVSEVTVWCSNDYLGMSQNSVVINSMIEAVKTAIINKRSGGMGLISGRKTFQKPMDEGVKLFHAIQDVYLDPEITLA